MKEENLIRDKGYKFSLEIIELYKFLIAKNEYVLSKQILGSGTSVGANIYPVQFLKMRTSFHGSSKEAWICYNPVYTKLVHVLN